MPHSVSLEMAETKKKDDDDDEKDALSKLLGPTVLAREEHRVQREVLRDAIVVAAASEAAAARTTNAGRGGNGRGGGGGDGIDDEEEDEENVPLAMLRSERMVEKLERDARDIDREIEAVEVATNDLFSEADASGSGGVRDVKLRKQVAAKRLAGLREKRAKVERELETAVEVSEAERRAFEKEKEKRKKEGKKEKKQTAGIVPKKKVVLVQDDFDFDAELDAAQKKSTTDNLLGGGSNGETERERLIRTGAMTPFDRLDGFDKARTDEAGKKLKEKTALLQSAKSKLKTIDLKDAPKQMEKMHSRAIGEAISRRVKPTKNGDSAAKKKLALKRKMWKEQSEQQMNKNKNGSAVKRKRRSSFQAYSSDEEEEEEELDGDADEDDDADEDVEFEGGLSVDGARFAKLLPHQKTAVKWLWELHCQRAGGIIGDEMGLGKTVQVAAFLGALSKSNLYQASIVVCPATMLRQWRRELKIWAPELKPVVLHDSAITQDALKVANGNRKNAMKNAIRSATRDPKGVIITTYECLRGMREDLLTVRWGYAVLDEGHKIRNPEAEITVVSKRLRTVHRIIMTGAPVQNRLSELWSLIDFVYPGKLGTLPVFQAQFAVPIQIGGYVNASDQAATTAYRCAVALKDLISPYLLRRLKQDLDINLPDKTEQVLFCPMTEDQRDAYKGFLSSREVEDIIDGRREALGGIDVLRKIVNHPDLLERNSRAGDANYGDPVRSGKLQVALKILSMWKSQGHRCLVFSQTQQMLDILEQAVAKEGYTYRRMDGTTPVAHRMGLVDSFNDTGNVGEEGIAPEDVQEPVFVFLLTTKVGGLGINLTGANRVLLFDPDWNPSTDAQARERAWRIGQKKAVTIYRLITTGTIEEKVYHRQIYKEFLTGKVLKDPKQRRFFKARDMMDLFAYDDPEEKQRGGGVVGSAAMGGGAANETAELFAEVEGEILAADCKDEDEESLVTVEEDGTLEEGETTAGNNGTIVEGVQRIETNRLNTNNTKDDNGKGDAAILKSLFDGEGGLHSAMCHDKILSAADGDRRAKIAFADRIARQAAEAVKRSGRGEMNGRSNTRLQAPQQQQINATTTSTTITRTIATNNINTGRFGSNNAGSRRLFSRIQQRREEDAAIISTNQDANANGNQEEEARFAQSLLKDIIQFLKSRGGEAPTGLVVDAFADKVTAERRVIFRNLLKQCARLERNPTTNDGSKGFSAWVLKPEYDK